MNLEECLPAHLRTAGTTITRVAAGLSGAGVHRIEADGHAYVLKIASADVPLDECGCQRTSPAELAGIGSRG